MSSNQYIYSILTFRTSLGYEATDIPLAAIVVSSSEGKGIIAVVGLKPLLSDDVTEQSSLSILNHVEEIVKSQIMNALSSTSSAESLFDALASQNRWNLYITPAQTYRSKKSIMVAAFDLFYKHVVDVTSPVEDMPPTAHGQSSTGVRFWGESLPADELTLA